jgi:hypothetical protein
MQRSGRYKLDERILCTVPEVVICSGIPKKQQQQQKKKLPENQNSWSAHYLANISRLTVIESEFPVEYIVNRIEYNRYRRSARENSHTML